jgi:hypothetical protein
MTYVMVIRNWERPVFCLRKYIRPVPTRVSHLSLNVHSMPDPPVTAFRLSDLEKSIETLHCVVLIHKTERTTGLPNACDVECYSCCVSLIDNKFHHLRISSQFYTRHTTRREIKWRPIGLMCVCVFFSSPSASCL